ncbi:unnamed protein product [Brassica oleracea var. botrytis]
MANFFCFVVHPPWRYCFSGFGRPDGGKLMGDMLLRDAKVIPFFKVMFIFVYEHTAVFRFMNTQPDGFESGCLFVFFVKSFSGRLIPATVNVNRLATYRPHFKAGSM